MVNFIAPVTGIEDFTDDGSVLVSYFKMAEHFSQPPPLHMRHQPVIVTLQLCGHTNLRLLLASAAERKSFQ